MFGKIVLNQLDAPIPGEYQSKNDDPFRQKFHNVTGMHTPP
jgi:hypothetical protein